MNLDVLVDLVHVHVHAHLCIQSTCSWFVQVDLKTYMYNVHVPDPRKCVIFFVIFTLNQDE